MLIRRTTIPSWPLVEKLFSMLLFVLALWGVGDGLASLKDTKFTPFLEAWPIFLLLLGGSVLNWGLEAWKWALLARGGLELSYKASLKGVLAGVTIGMWMPGRIGAWIGKMHFVPRGERSRAMFPLMASSAVQFFVTVMMAAIACLFWAMDPGIAFGELSSKGVFGMGALFTHLLIFGGVATYSFLHSPRGKKCLDKLGFRSDQLLKVRELSLQRYSKVLGLATFRYLVFLGQFVLALGFLVPEGSVPFFFLSVPISLFILSVLPSFVLSKLGVREMVIVAVMAPICGHQAQLILASLSIWVVNLALPALLGVFFLLPHRLFIPRSDRALER